MAAGEELEPNSSAALLVWENVWARDVAQKIRDAGGVLLDFERLPHEVVQAARDAVLANALEERRPTMMRTQRPGTRRAGGDDRRRRGDGDAVSGRVARRQQAKYAAQDQAAVRPAGRRAGGRRPRASRARLHGRARAARAAPRPGHPHARRSSRRRRSRSSASEQACRWLALRATGPVRIRSRRTEAGRRQHA